MGDAMSCGEARKEIDAFLDGELRGTAVRDHVLSCVPCARVADQQRAFSAAVARSLERAIDGVEPDPEAPLRVVDQLISAPVRRLWFAAFPQGGDAERDPGHRRSSPRCQ